ncbi:MAG TPA: acyl-CoA thioesterase [Geobacter sp.]|nr:acyl-CoA thioesterase [Geobacter sp.]
MAKEYSTTIELRFSDLDAYGHVNSAIYFTYLETARVKLFSDFFREVSEQAIFTVVAHAECDFKVPILLYDEVVVTVWVSRLGSSSFDLEYRLHNEQGTTYATALTTMVCFDAVNKKAVPIPESIKVMA